MEYIRTAAKVRDQTQGVVIFTRLQVCSRAALSETLVIVSIRIGFVYIFVRAKLRIRLLHVRPQPPGFAVSDVVT